MIPLMQILSGRTVPVTIIELKIIKYQNGEGMAGLTSVPKCPVHLLLCRTGCSTLKGLCHEMNNFLKVLKIKSVLSVYALMVFKFFSCLVMEKIKDEVLACFYENT